MDLLQVPTTLVLLVALALAFDFMNGFHDAANSIATVVSTQVLKPWQAVLWAAAFNVLAWAVFHLAAQSLVRASYERPLETYATNVLGTAHVLDAVRAHGGVRAVVVVTTDKCYENREWPWGYRENEPLGGHDPYSSSKACAELVSSAWRRSFLADSGIALATARAGNVIGGGDWAEDRLVPDVLRALQGGVRAAAARRHHGHATAVGGLLALVLDVLILLGELGLGGDVDLPARETGSETRVLAVTSDRQ